MLWGRLAFLPLGARCAQVRARTRTVVAARHVRRWRAATSMFCGASTESSGVLAVPMGSCWSGHALVITLRDLFDCLGL